MRLSPTLAAALLSGALCASCAPQPIQIVSSVTTSQASVLSAHQDQRSQFGNDETIVVLTYVTWPDVTAPGGRHTATWNWYRGDQLVSTSNANVNFRHAPGDLFTRRVAASLGPGTYHVDTLLDGQLLATNAFKINAAPIASGYDPKTADLVCQPEPAPASASQVVRPLNRPGPAYPRGALQSGMPGCAVVTLTMDQAGHPQNIQIVAEYPPGWGFGEATAEAASRLLFPEGHPGAFDEINVKFNPNTQNH